MVSAADAERSVEAFSPDLIVIACQPGELLELLDRVDKIPLIVASNTGSLGDAARYIRLGPTMSLGRETTSLPR